MNALDVLHNQTLMGLWSQHKRECRPIGDIVADARAGRLPGVAEPPGIIGFRITDEQAALAAMRGEVCHR